MEENLPRPNARYITAGILQFFDNEKDSFFNLTFAQLPFIVIRELRSQELDTEEQRKEVKFLLEERSEKPTKKEENSSS